MNTRLYRHRTLILLTGVLLIIQSTFSLGADAAGRDPTSVLRNEHELIRKMAVAAGDTAARIRDTGTVDLARVARFQDFFTNFADRCHHAKEEEELFPVLRAELDDPTALDLLLKQHEEGRILLAGIDRQMSALKDGDTATAREALARYLQEYSQLMTRHIDLENEYLWPQAAAQLNGAEKDALVEAFHRIEVEELGEGFHEKYHGLAMEVLGKDAS